MNVQIAKTWPNLRRAPSVRVDERSTKNPMTTQTVAGKKLKKKHMAFTSVLLCHERLADASSRISRPVVEMRTSRTLRRSAGTKVAEPYSTSRSGASSW